VWKGEAVFGEMEQVYEAALRALRERESAAVVTVIEAKGSTP
jgi:hypothetical protein